MVRLDVNRIQGEKSMGTSGQIGLFVIISFIIIILLTFYFFSNINRVKSKSDIEAGDLRARSKELKSLEIKISTILDSVVYNIVYEMGKHGGYTRDSVPLLSNQGVPYWFYKGRVVNIPSITVMSHMLSGGIRNRITERLRKIQLGRKDINIGLPEIKSEIKDSVIIVELNVPLSIKREDLFLKTVLKLKKRYNLRLKELRDIAEKYVRNYTVDRRIELALKQAIEQDYRTPIPPAGPGDFVPCGSKTIFRTKAQMEAAVKEHVVYASQMEVVTIRKSDIIPPDAHIDVAYEVDVDSLNFSFIANRGDPEFESMDFVYLKPMELFSYRKCTSFYTIEYFIDFPVKIIFKDVLGTYKVVGEETAGSELTFLEFEIFLRAYLDRLDWKAEDNSVTVPETVEDMCAGACQFSLEIYTPENGDPVDTATVVIDNCVIDVTPGDNGRVLRDNFLCKVHTLKIFTEMYAPYVEKININKSLHKVVILRDFSSIEGSVFENHTIYCKNTGEISYSYFPLRYRAEGGNIYGAQVIIKPVIAEYGEAVFTTTDENGRYRMSHLSPGKYIFIAMPLEDRAGRPSYPVQAEGRVIYLDPGENTGVDIFLKPLQVVNINNRFYYISEEKNC